MQTNEVQCVFVQLNEVFCVCAGESSALPAWVCGSADGVLQPVPQIHAGAAERAGQVGTPHI